MSDYIQITTACNKEEIANEIIKKLLDERLIACAQKLNINSSYVWQGQRENENEILIIMKTRKSLFEEVKRQILFIHDYDLPEIVATDFTCGLEDYFKWIDENTKEE
ncbi:MAG: divalent-cation tolerance protein CutA [Clostridia bacterium]|nr:divalent-cation tolerance protein CutA [Bacilli bacterium]MBR3511450.1 divalent-cation tolerance protein CutA [Clostridia bacterium]